VERGIIVLAGQQDVKLHAWPARHITASRNATIRQSRGHWRSIGGELRDQLIKSR
jgi:hypothetical protein